MAGAVQRAGFALPEKRRSALGTTPSSRCSDSKSETFVTNQEASPRIFGAADAVLGVVIVKVKWLGVRMPDLVVRGMDTMLLERVRRLALSRGWSHRQAVSVLIECGLFYIDTHPGNGFASIETEVLREAASALQQLPDGADF